MSDEPWAWATYHYGRWDFTDRYGWYWVPQTQWAPAWVSWHSGGGYVGWAPLYPSGVVVIAPRAYVFVEQRRFLDPISPTIVAVNSTTIINKAMIHEAPTTTVIAKASGRKVQAVPVQELRHKTEAAVVAKQRTPTATGEKKTVAAPAPPPVQKPAAVTPESAKPARAAPKFKPEAKPGGNHPPAIKEPTQPKADQHVEKPEKPTKASDKKTQRPAKERPAASEKDGANPAENEHGEKTKE